MQGLHKLTDAIYLDFCKAFNMIPHDSLISKLDLKGGLLSAGKELAGWIWGSLVANSVPWLDGAPSHKV